MNRRPDHDHAVDAMCFAMSLYTSVGQSSPVSQSVHQERKRCGGLAPARIVEVVAGKGGHHSFQHSDQPAVGDHRRGLVFEDAGKTEEGAESAFGCSTRRWTPPSGRGLPESNSRCAPTTPARSRSTTRLASCVRDSFGTRFSSTANISTPSPWRSSAGHRSPPEATTFVIWNMPLPAVVFGPVIANGSFTSTPAVRFYSRRRSV